MVHWRPEGPAQDTQRSRCAGREIPDDPEKDRRPSGGGAAEARQISGELRIPERDVYDHLEHIRKTMEKGKSRLAVAPAQCERCGFVFRKRARLKKPGRCPICRSESVQEPVFSIEKRDYAPAVLLRLPSSPFLQKKYQTHPRPHRMMIASMMWCSIFLDVENQCVEEDAEEKTEQAHHNRPDKRPYEIQDDELGDLDSLISRERTG